jgi:hypothetical protein
MSPKSKNAAASALGRRAAGIPKHFSKAELIRRRLRLALARLKRWPQTKERRANRAWMTRALRELPHRRHTRKKRP